MFLLVFLSLFLGIKHGSSLPTCHQSCAEVYQPVCGSNYHTYQNLCMLQSADCQSMSNGQPGIAMLYGGACRTSSSAAKCNILCDDEAPDELVCASNAETYRNKCVFQAAECEAAQNGFALKIVHLGKCTSKDISCPDRCDYHIEPVCTTSNITYRNPCLLQQAVCKYGRNNHTDYELAHQGSCDGSNIFETFEVDCRQYETRGNFAPENQNDLLISDCPKVKAPVCSQSLATYENACDLCKIMAKTQRIGPDKTVLIAHNGSCPVYTYSIFG